jgi:outer membrane murein-binding lipoprotein Lpp
MNKAILSAAVAIMVGILGVAGTSINSKAEREAQKMDTLYSRVSDLEVKYAQEQAINRKQSEVIADLKTELASKFVTQEVAIKDFMDNAPFPAWAKLVKEGMPEMWHINPYYEMDFKISKEFYVGKNDFEVWPRNIAQGYYERDVFVMNTLLGKCEEEEVNYTPTGPMVGPTPGEPVYNILVCKWPTKIAGKLAIAGVVLPAGT